MLNVKNVKYKATSKTIKLPVFFVTYLHQNVLMQINGNTHKQLISGVQTVILMVCKAEICYCMFSVLEIN